MTACEFSLCELYSRDGRRQVSNGRGFAALENNDILKSIDDKDAKATKNVIEGAARILNCTVVQYNKTLIY
jgi:hypothetical protein